MHSLTKNEADLVAEHEHEHEVCTWWWWWWLVLRRGFGRAVWCGVVFVCVAVLRGERGGGKGREEMDGASFMINKSSMESIADVIASQLCWMMDG